MEGEHIVEIATSRVHRCIGEHPTHPRIPYHIVEAISRLAAEVKAVCQHAWYDLTCEENPKLRMQFFEKQGCDSWGRRCVKRILDNSTFEEKPQLRMNVLNEGWRKAPLALRLQARFGLPKRSGITLAMSKKTKAHGTAGRKPSTRLLMRILS